MSQPNHPGPASLPPLPLPLPPLPPPGAPFQQQAPQGVLPYATPFAAAQQPAYAAWRDGLKLITPANAVLPPQCVKCGAPADGHYGQRTFWWHHPALLLLILVNILVFAIVALIVRKKAVVQLGLCAAHLARRRQVLAISWVLGLGGVASLITGFYQMFEYRNDTAPLIGTLIALAMWITAAVLHTKLGAYLTPTIIDAQYAHFKGAGPEFLSLFPPVR